MTDPTIAFSDANEKSISQAYLNDGNKMVLPIFCLYEDTCIANLKENKLIMFGSYQGDTSWIMQTLMEMSLNKVLVNLTARTIAYDFDTKTFLNTTGFTIFPKRTEKSSIIVKDSSGQIFKCYPAGGYPLVMYANYYLQRLYNYKMTPFAKNLFLDMIIYNWDLKLDRTMGFSYAYGLEEPKDSCVRELDEKNFDVLTKMCVKLSKKKQEQFNKNNIDVSAFIKLKDFPLNPVWLNDDLKLFDAKITNVYFTPLNKIYVYYDGHYLPNRGTEGIKEILKLGEKKVEIYFRANDVEEDGVWNRGGLN